MYMVDNIYRENIYKVPLDTPENMLQFFFEEIIIIAILQIIDAGLKKFQTFFKTHPRTQNQVL